METEKMDIQFEHETSEECEMSLQDNENTIDKPEKENKPPRSFLIKLALALTKGLGSSIEILELDWIRHKIK